MIGLIKLVGVFVLIQGIQCAGIINVSNDSENISVTDTFYSKLIEINSLLNINLPSIDLLTDALASIDFSQPQAVVEAIQQYLQSQDNTSILSIGRLLGAFLGLIPNYGLVQYASDLQVYIKEQLGLNLNTESDFVVNISGNYNTVINSVREQFAVTASYVQQVIDAAKDYIAAYEAESTDDLDSTTLAIDNITLAIVNIVKSIDHFQSSTIGLDIIQLALGWNGTTVPILQNKLPQLKEFISIWLDTVFVNSIQFLNLFSSSGILVNLLDFISDNLVYSSNILGDLGTIFTGFFYFIYETLGALPFLRPAFDPLKQFIDLAVQHFQLRKVDLVDLSILINTIRFLVTQNTNKIVIGQYNDLTLQIQESFSLIYIQLGAISTQLPNTALQNTILQIELTIAHLVKAVSTLTEAYIQRVGASNALSIVIKPQLQRLIVLIEEVVVVITNLNLNHISADVNAKLRSILAIVRNIVNENITNLNGFLAKINATIFSKDKAAFQKTISKYLLNLTTYFNSVHVRLVQG